MVTASGLSNGNELRYTGREDDTTTISYYRARYYHPSLQRFISEDPIGFLGDDVNLYTYARNSGVDLRDPLGLRVEWGNYVLTKSSSCSKCQST